MARNLCVHIQHKFGSLKRIEKSHLHMFCTNCHEKFDIRQDDDKLLQPSEVLLTLLYVKNRLEVCLSHSSQTIFESVCNYARLRLSCITESTKISLMMSSNGDNDIWSCKKCDTGSEKERIVDILNYLIDRLGKIPNKNYGGFRTVAPCE